MVEPDRIKKLFDNLDGAIARLRILQPLPRQEFLADFTKSESAKHLLQVSIQSCLDVCYHIQVYDILQTRLGDFERFISYIRAFTSTEEEEGTEL